MGGYEVNPFLGNTRILKALLMGVINRKLIALKTYLGGQLRIFFQRTHHTSPLCLTPSWWVVIAISKSNRITQYTFLRRMSRANLNSLDFSLFLQNWYVDKSHIFPMFHKTSNTFNAINFSQKHLSMFTKSPKIFLDTQMSLAPTHVSPSIGPLVILLNCWSQDRAMLRISGHCRKCIFWKWIFKKCIFWKCIFPKCISRSIFSQSVFSQSVFPQSVFF